MALPSLLSAASGSAVIAAVSPVRRCEGSVLAIKQRSGTGQDEMG